MREYCHIPVLVNEVLYYLNLKGRESVVDSTVGCGGHAEVILKVIGSRGKLIGIDRDGSLLRLAEKRLSKFKKQTYLLKGNYKDIPLILENLKIEKVDGILFDLGVSSEQLNNPERGFSYQKEELLDMRFDLEEDFSAIDVVNDYSQKELTEVIKNFGEEKWASRIAQFIVQERKRKRIETTGHLVKIIKEAIPAGARRRGGHPAKKTFQALRIEVNKELDGLEQALKNAFYCLKSKGRLVVISYHSLEDRIVKQLFKKLYRESEVNLLTKKVVVPSSEEIRANPRARSAKLRALERVIL